ncbi:MBOAT family O-acyltransferase [Candidatus Uabimicrobium amorphum]|uniref:Alginate O-acetyltransferase n=1 Tax=Uabimicrobium amorphum TaxID=2596890 RepID=A0A5S9F371_UABAM|nr:MBOAT family O-acyltransferase [Candidatus Uabimicrobium amorphum]BBM84212.1 alginate O-acetyltransferase [Candidatus Uabimicrobium amorphum]
MLFNSNIFIVFFLIVYTIYRTVSHKKQNILLLISSYIFYGFWDYRFLSLILISTIIDFFCGQHIADADSKKAKKKWLLLSVCCNLGILGFFKYFNFFVDSLQQLLQTFDVHPAFLRLEIVLPVGISFYTFQTMSYAIDIYRGKLQPTRSFLNFAVFVAYFPQLVAGPIERAARLIPQIESVRKISRSQIKSGLCLIVWGYFKKVYVADNIAVLVNQIFSMEPSALSFWYVLLGCYAFAFQIYGDFSGYSDIARGISKLLGIELMINFASPYFVTNPADFWTHWHISLSSWLRDYLYIPLGGNRVSEIRTKINLFTTMVLGGLWHGAAWNFVWWGIYQGSLLMFFRSRRKKYTSVLSFVVMCFVTFQFTALGWLIFRAQSGQQILEMLWGLTILEIPSIDIITKFLGLVFFSFFVIGEQYDKLRNNNEIAFSSYSIVTQYCIYFYLIFCILFLAAPGAEQFIYFQF